MSRQIPDPFIWEYRDLVFLGASDIEKLFNPKKYGLHPTPPSTSCWKGFVVHFRIKNKQLYLDGLDVYCENGRYPPINGVRPVQKNYFHVYENINYKLRYSGTIIVGKGLISMYRRSAFTGPHSYETTYQLTIKKGVLESYIETSGQYSRY